MADSIGERLKQARHKHGWSLRDLADRAQVPLSTLSYVETGKRPGHGLSLETSKRLAVALQVSLDWLAFGKEDAHHG
jgi:transcriptional regulator with XRE-family HTH domain